MFFDLPLNELENYRGVSPKPLDFDKYWDDTLTEIPENGADYTLEDAEINIPGIICRHLYYIAEDGSRIHARLVRPENAKNTPAIAMFHGYSGSFNNFFNLLPYAAAGFTVLALDCRGQGGLSEDLTASKGATYSGLIIRGMEEGAKKLYYRRVYMDTVRCARILMSMDCVDPKRVGAQGISQGGALTLACASLEPRIRFAQVRAPFLCDFKRVIDLGLMRDAYQELNWHFTSRDPRHEQQDEFLNTLGYIDIANLAPRIRADIYWSIGLSDTICPPSCQFAAYNNITSPKTMKIYPEYDHSVCGVDTDEQLSFLMSF